MMCLCLYGEGRAQAHTKFGGQLTVSWLSNLVACNLSMIHIIVFDKKTWPSSRVKFDNCSLDSQLDIKFGGQLTVSWLSTLVVCNLYIVVFGKNCVGPTTSKWGGHLTIKFESVDWFVGYQIFQTVWVKWPSPTVWDPLQAMWSQHPPKFFKFIKFARVRLGSCVLRSMRARAGPDIKVKPPGP